ncbi:class I SAM-dependent methyltransferase [Cypionkella sp.]|uniref:class I SAM-dependent methyltransferase n=1 Tax=Cypionkella sp. TaxID=2811411 RepID=UPI00260700B6|nr:class I SAM-dependent methyltransferase [Cypionkella sp.]MDB5664488.1 methyltransferase type 11 [Cypionkella sp.]
MSDTLAPPTPNLAALKTRQQAAWASGNYAVVGTTLQIVGEQLCEALDLRAGSKVLDVAAGNGNATLAAARRWAKVTSTDYVPALLELGRARAEAEGVDVTFTPADAEALPFADGGFDVVLSTFGVMFTPDQDRAAQELLRVCRKGGKIGLANWTPDGFIGQLFKIIGTHLPPPAGVKSPSLWGTEARLAELFPQARVNVTRKEFAFRYLSPQHWLEVFRTWYGPTHKAFLALDVDRQHALAADMLGLAERMNSATDGTLVARGAYLEAVIEKL